MISMYQWITQCDVCEGTPILGDTMYRVTKYVVVGKGTGWLKVGTNCYYCEGCWKSQDVEVDEP